MSIIQRCFGLLLWLIIAPGQLPAQKALSLEDCINEALKQNLRIKSAAISVRQTEEKIRQTKSALYPQISGEYNYQYNFDIPVTFLPGSILGAPQKYVTAAAGLAQQQYIKFSLSQQLINPQLFIALKLSQELSELSGLQFEQVREDIVYNTSATYYNLLTLHYQQILLLSNIASFDELIKSTQLLVDNQLAKSSDLNRLAVSRENLQVQLDQVLVSREQLGNVLKQLMGASLNDSVHIITEMDTLASFPASMIDATKKIDLQLLEKQLRLKSLENKSIRSAYLPSLVAFASYNSYAYSEKFNPFDRLNNTSYPVTLVGISLSIPIYDGGEKASRLRYNRLEQDVLRNQIALQRDQSEADRRNAWASYQANLKALRSQTGNLELARKIFDETRVTYREGLASVTDIINTNNELQKAQNDYLGALVNVRKALLDVKKATGNLTY